MAAGMHGVTGLRGVLDARLFLQRQPVHVAAQQHHGALAGGDVGRGAAAQDGGDRGQVLAQADLVTQRLQPFQHPFLGAGKLQPNLGRLVQGVAQRRDLRRQFLRVLED